MKFVADAPLIARKKDTTAFLVTEEQAGALTRHLPDDFSRLLEGLDLSFIKGKPGEVHHIPLSNKSAVIIAGLGATTGIVAEGLRNAAAGITGICRERGVVSLLLAVPESPGMDIGDTARALADGCALANYRFDRHKSAKRDELKPLMTEVRVSAPRPLGARFFTETEILSRNTHRCRDLVNETSDLTDAEGIAAAARKIGKLRHVRCRIFGEREIRRMGMGLLLAVNRGSSKPPRLIVLTYRGNPADKSLCALVGKGITFDSGGLNLKPSGHIESMRSDMAGAAAVLYAVSAAAELGIKKNVCAVVPLTDNMLASNSYRPGDVYRAYNGITVEIGNTDAEGRLVLADAIAYADARLKPSCIVDMATLTGACVMTFGELIAAYLTADGGLAEKLEIAAARTGEKLWRLPLDAEYDDNLKSDIADLVNISSERNAGTIMGAAFLKNFVTKAKWAHIDIASTSWFTKARGYRPRNATGYGVRLLVEMLKSMD